MTTKEKISAKFAFATVLMWACLLTVAAPLIYALYRLSQTQDGLEGMGIVLMVFTWGVVLLFPLYGFAEALRWRRSLQDDLRKLETKEMTDAG